MAESTEINENNFMVAALFKSNDDANKAIQELTEEGYYKENISLTLKLDEEDKKKARKEALKAKGFEDPDTLYLLKAVEEGDSLVTVLHVTEKQTGEVVKIFNENGSHYNPDGDRNIRQDVVGMSAGAVVGGVVGALIAGPVGAAAGTAVGASIGGAVGDKVEKDK